MKKCSKNILLILEFIVAILTILVILPFSYFVKYLPENLGNILVENEILCKVFGVGFVVLFVSFIAILSQRAALKRNGNVAFPFHKAVIFPLVSYVLALSGFLLHKVYTSTIFEEKTGMFTAYGLVCAIIIIFIFFGLLARVIYKKEKKFLPNLFNLILVGLFAGAIIATLENKEYFTATPKTIYYNCVFCVFGFLILVNYLILVIGLNKVVKFEYQQKEAMKAIEEAAEEEKESVVEEETVEIKEESVVEEEIVELKEEAVVEEEIVEIKEESVVEEEAVEIKEESVVEEEILESKEEVVAEEKPVEEAKVTDVAPTLPKPKKLIKPTPQALLKYLQDNFTDIVIVVDPDGVSFKASRKKKLFISLKQSVKDYRITFQRKPISISKLIVKYPSITKAKSPVGDQWFKLVNKGEFSEADLHNIIKGSYNFLIDEENKEALKKQKEKEKAALKKQKEKEKAAELRKKQKEKEKLAAKKAQQKN